MNAGTSSTEDFIEFVRHRMASLIPTEEGDFKFAGHQLMRIYRDKCRGVLYLPMKVNNNRIILT